MQKRFIKVFRVVSVSRNTNSFGLSGVILLARDGLAYEVGRNLSAHPTAKGDEVAVKYVPGSGELNWAGVGCELPRALPAPPASGIAEIWS